MIKKIPTSLLSSIQTILLNLHYTVHYDLLVNKQHCVIGIQIWPQIHAVGETMRRLHHSKFMFERSLALENIVKKQIFHFFV